MSQITEPHPAIVMPNALFDPAESHSQDYTALSENFRDTFNTGVYPALFGDGIAEAGALSDTYTTYEPIFGPLYDFENPFTTTTVTNLKNTWRGFFEGTK